MKKRHFLPFLILFALLETSCKKNITDTVIAPPSDTSNVIQNYVTKEIEIMVPAGSSFKAAGSKVFSFGTKNTADASGKAKVTFEKGSSTLAYVFNDNKKLILAGFITDSTNIISPATTAKVLLYLGYNIPLQPDTLSVYFLNNIDKLSAAKEWEKEFETLFLADPLTLSNKSFVAPLKARMAKMIDQTPAIDIRARAAEIDVDASDIKSGLQISSDALSKFSITNNYRRRAHAFLYKMSYKELSGVNHEIKNKIDVNTSAETDMAVSPISAVSGFLGEIGKNIEGKGLESISVTSDPYPLELKDDESEALYKIRIVGPGGISKLKFTAAEDKKNAQLEMETFLFDFVIPAVGIATSLPKKNEFGNLSIGTDSYSRTDAMMTFVKAMPDVYDEIKQGNYKNALTKLLENVYKDVGGSLLNELYGIALGKRLTGDVKTFFTNNFEHLLLVLNITDAVLGTSDLVRITFNIKSSNQLEEWEIKAKSGLVTLSPERSVVVPYQKQTLTAAIRNNTQTAYYEWSTSGKYGKLTDTKGHTDLVSFSSQDKDVSYTSKVTAASLSDGDNLEYIYVNAFIGSTKVGSDTAVINVKKEKYVMKPTGITISGREGSQHEVRLYLVKTNGTNEIAPNNTADYKVIWTTTGTYGKLNAKDITGVRTLTLYDDNSAYYECFDKDTKAATETIKARIYIKLKGEPESEYRLFEEVAGSIKIDNDPKKKILHLPVFLLHGDTSFLVGTQMGYNCAKVWAAQFHDDMDAKSYTIQFHDAKNTPNESYSWVAGGATPAPPISYAGKSYSNGVFTITWTGTLNSFAGWSDTHANGGTPSGEAQVTITLK